MTSPALSTSPAMAIETLVQIGATGFAMASKG